MSKITLFEGHGVRSAALAGAIAIGAWFMIGAIPNNLYALNITQTSVALLALSALAVFVVAHHRAQATVITRSQEEMALIGAFGLFFFALLVAVQAFKGRGVRDDYDYVEPATRAARGVAQAAQTAVQTAARRGNQVAPNVREWEAPYNRWKDGYITEEYVYY